MEASVLPLELRREELSIREGGKIMSKDDSQTIKQLNNGMNGEMVLGVRQVACPFLASHKIWRQILEQVI